jgi:dihydroorotase
MSKTIIKNATIVNEGKTVTGDVLITDNIIERIAPQLDTAGAKEINGEGLHLIPGIIDDQVHFREPGLTHKGDIYTEAKAAVAGGVTSFMDMPNTNPAAITNELLEEKYKLGAQKSLANYSFYLGTSNANIEEVKRMDVKNVSGIKIFMGSSTGNLAITDNKVLEQIFQYAPTLVATHCEDDAMIKENLEKYRAQYGDAIPIKYHPDIRNAANCLKSSTLATGLAKKYNTRLHILHISTADELALFSNKEDLSKKRITAEACVHHLWFDSSDYERLGPLIKCNPAIKDAHHKEKLFAALLDNTLDIIATDHAPHTLEEKFVEVNGKLNYIKCPSGLPLVQHSLNVMLQFYHQQKITLERVIEKMCHAPAVCFQVEHRGFIREGYFADLALVDLNKKWTVEKNNILYKCGWSPFEGDKFKGKVTHTFVNGNLVYNNGTFNESEKGKRLTFKR